MITLINGPYNGRQIEDSGAVSIRMAIYDGGETQGAKIGHATYEPNEERTAAFWLGNTWEGTLDEQIRNDA